MGKLISGISEALNRVAAISIAGMMILTCADVILRLFRFPIPGTYEMVGFLGAVLVSFSLARTSMDHGHIAVDFFVSKLPQAIQNIISGINTLICAVLFGLATWHSILYANDIRRAGEVSLTLQMPIYPFIYGCALGCGMLCIVLVLHFIDTFVRKEEI